LKWALQNQTDTPFRVMERSPFAPQSEHATVASNVRWLGAASRGTADDDAVPRGGAGPRRGAFRGGSIGGRNGTALGSITQRSAPPRQTGRRTGSEGTGLAREIGRSPWVTGRGAASGALARGAAGIASAPRSTTTTGRSASPRVQADAVKPTSSVAQTRITSNKGRIQRT